MGLVVFPVAFISISIGKDQASSPLNFILFPLSFKHRSITPHLNPSPLAFFIFGPISRVDMIILYLPGVLQNFLLFFITILSLIFELFQLVLNFFDSLGFYEGPRLLYSSKVAIKIISATKGHLSIFWKHHL
jgi:hypothetical protein